MEIVNLEIDTRMTANSMLTHAAHATPVSTPTGTSWAGLDRHADQASDLLKRLFYRFGAVRAQQPDADLEQAQQAKLDLICRKLRLQPNDRLLHIGCGSGALVMHAARHYGARAHGVMLSQRHLKLARQRIAQARLEDRVTVELRDYRDLQGDAVYDKVASVGMFEHVGLKNLPGYFAAVHRLLKPAGLVLNHGITHDVQGWDKTSSAEFINRYVFPDGQLDTVGNLQRSMERARFEIADVEALRPHYALTLSFAR